MIEQGVRENAEGAEIKTRKARKKARWDLEESFYHQYAEADELHWWFVGRQRIVSELLQQWLPEGRGRKILDVGCGTGGMLKLLAGFGEVHGVEPSASAVEYSRARVGDLAAVHHGTIPDGVPAGMSFDLVTAFDVIEHMEDAVAVLRQLRLLMAPGGVLVCTVPAFEFLWSEHDDINHHFRRYTRGLLKRELEDAGFEVRYASYFNTFLFPPIAAVRLIARLLPSRGSVESDLGMPPPAVNRFLGAMFGAERYLMRVAPLPFGVSLAAVAVLRETG